MAEWKLSVNNRPVSSGNSSSDEEGFPVPPPLSEPITIISNKKNSNHRQVFIILII